ncbi:MAG: tryptophan 7-halogenase, partial [Acidobacteria bacterium]|nr:tryptophan 7-halogenase [Acidobacteriota bacterium]
MNSGDDRLQQHDPFDAVIVGGGPAGATAGAFLAQKGWRVLLLEKERFPRYRIGESLMPYCYFTLERLGVIDKIKSSHFPRKYSVQFVSTRGAVSTPFYFFEHFNHEAATTWQVLRSEFDQMLLDNAREKGVEVREGTRAVETVDGQGAVAGVRAIDGQGGKHEFRAPLTLDASGREVFSMTRNRW